VSKLVRENEKTWNVKNQFFRKKTVLCKLVRENEKTSKLEKSIFPEENRRV